eukprot:6212414-Pleurochrysis_carterae.AAC.1
MRDVKALAVFDAALLRACPALVAASRVRAMCGGGLELALRVRLRASLRALKRRARGLAHGDREGLRQAARLLRGATHAACPSQRCKAR